MAPLSPEDDRPGTVARQPPAPNTIDMVTALRRCKPVFLHSEVEKSRDALLNMRKVHAFGECDVS